MHEQIMLKCACVHESFPKESILLTEHLHIHAW